MIILKKIHLTLSIFCAILINMYIAQKSIDSCLSKRTCGECIRDPKCSWHIKTDDNKDHCRSAKPSDKGSNIISPQTEAININEFSSEHLSPNSVNLKIRPGQPYKLNFEYTHKVNYPVDIYFLMDMSKSMQHYRQNIAILAYDLVQKMKEKTTDVQIGFGSFVDKTLLPYVNAFPNKIQSPCSGCEIPYSFINHLKLTENVEEFSSKVNSTPISANIDGPEGSLEALLQVIVCTEEIGWRPNARHLIILSTDDAFHIAGDGKLAGIVEPNDGECHLENNVYNHGHLQDYPSVGQIHRKAVNKTKHILFLVTPTQEELYAKLQKSITNSYLGLLQTNSENIINVVTEFYNNITSSIRIEHNFGSNFDIKISSENCAINKNIECIVSNDKIYKFAADIRLTSCPSNEKYTENYYLIKPNTLSEAITIRMELLCDCSCEHAGDGNYEENSNKCNKNGDLQCGVCKCIPGKIGDQCQCDENSDVKNVDDSSKCRYANSTEDCSGNGECKCGECVCIAPFTGIHCQCNDHLCITNKINNETCSNHGTCDCGKCSCFEDWTDSKCDCYKPTDKCKAPGSNEICSGNGECKCGKCLCTDKEKYGGTYCDECKTCPKTCSDFETCVKYFYNQKLSYDLKCDKFTINETENLNITENLCNYQDEKNCLITFAFNYVMDDRSAEILTQKVCPPTQAGLFSLYIIASILIAGIIAMLIWKAFAIMADRREYAKFENEAMNPKWNAEENPLFKKATSEFQNPLFKKSN